MEIIHLVLGKANPNRMNGVNKVVHQLATRQANAGQKVSVWGITKDTTPNYGKRNFHTRLFKASFQPFGIPEGFNLALDVLKKDTVIHIHGGWIPVFYSISGLLKAKSIPFVFTPHGAYNQVAMQRSAFLKKLYFQQFEKKLIQRASKIHCLGSSEVGGLNAIFPNDKSVLLPYGFEKEGFEFDSDPMADRRFTIGFVGRLDVYTKGLDLLVEAFKKFHSIRANAELWIVGDGPERVSFEKQVAKMGLGQSIRFLGSQFGPTKDQIMGQMDVFAHPSRNEGLPASILEAAQMGIPLLVSEATNMADLVRQYQCGLAVENENASQLTVSLLSLYDAWETGKSGRMGNAARTMVETEFNWNTVLNKFNQQLYANL